MKSYEVMREAVTGVGAKAVASEMSLSSSLIYKWCEPTGHAGAPGADNPLDRICRICEVTGDTRPVRWLCEASGGFFVENPPSEPGSTMPLLSATREILREFTELLDALTASVENDGEIDETEAHAIRSEWEDLKRAAERFVVAGEKGLYRNREKG